MADFRLRIGFSQQGAAIWLSHLEVVRAMERCVRRSGLPYTVSQGFSPHMKHSFSSALPVGTGSTGEFMDLELSALVAPEHVLEALQRVHHEDLPILSAEYVAKDDASLQVYYNYSTYRIVLGDRGEVVAGELLDRLREKKEIEVQKKGKLKTYKLESYVAEAKRDDADNKALILSLFSRPEGSLRPEVILEAVALPDLELPLAAITRIALEHREI